ncbi:MAG: DMT family transporter [Coriobacteriia bacterium]
MSGTRMDASTGAAVAFTLVFWASAFAGIKEGLVGYAPGQLALVRFGTASLVLAIYAVVTRMRLPRLTDLSRLGVAGFLGITIYHVSLNFGELTVSAGAASLLIAAAPVFTALLAAAFLGERLTTWGWFGIGVAFSGVAAIAVGESGGGLAFEPGALLILLAAVSTSAYFVVSKPLLKRYRPLEFTAYAIWAGTVPMLVFAPGLVEQAATAPLSATMAGIYIGVFPGALAYVSWSRVLSRLPASAVSTFLYIAPVLAIIIAWVWIGEVPAITSLAGGAVAIAGVAIVQTKGVRRAQVPAQ